MYGHQKLYIDNTGQVHLTESVRRISKDIAFAMAGGLDLDGARILEKGSLQEVETGAVVPAGILHVEK